MPSREEYLKWAEEVPISALGNADDTIEALCNRVWNEALGAIEQQMQQQYEECLEPEILGVLEEIRKLKQGGSSA